MGWLLKNGCSRMPAMYEVSHLYDFKNHPLIFVKMCFLFEAILIISFLTVDCREIGTTALPQLLVTVDHNSAVLLLIKMLKPCHRDGMISIVYLLNSNKYHSILLTIPVLSFNNYIEYHPIPTI